MKESPPTAHTTIDRKTEVSWCCTETKTLETSNRCKGHAFFEKSSVNSLLSVLKTGKFSASIITVDLFLGCPPLSVLRPTRKLSINWAGNRCSGENFYFPHKKDHTVQHWWWRLGLADVRQWEKRWKWRRLWRQRKARNFVCPQVQSTKF